MENTTIGKYRIVRLIGEGGMASVYEAVHELLGTRVAIKVLNPLLSANNQISERFKNEARIMASLNHPAITRVIDFDESPQQLSIVMEYLEGEDLNQWVRREGALSEKQVREIFSQILSAFQYAHQMGIVHRDIKPSNIFIGPNLRVKVLDFGIAKLFGQGTERTQTGMQMGTPIYMSPEQVKSDKSIDFRSDIYSLGVTLFFMTNGKPPYDATLNSQFDIFTKIVFEPLPQLTSGNPFRSNIEKACEKDRERRFQSCEEWLYVLGKNNHDHPADEVSSDSALATASSAVLNPEINVINSQMKDTPEAQNGDAHTGTEAEVVLKDTPKRKVNRLLFITLGVLMTTAGLLLYFSKDGKSGGARAEINQAAETQNPSESIMENTVQGEKMEKTNDQQGEDLYVDENAESGSTEPVETSYSRIEGPIDSVVTSTIPNEEKEEKAEDVYTRTERRAEFPGGNEEWRRYLEHNLNVQVPIVNGAPVGNYIVIVRFIVSKNGLISEVTCEKDPGFGMCQEAIRVIKNGPRWIPASQNGQFVNAYRSQPFTFIVADE